jgi:arylsulfatase A-like enzyme
MIVPRNETMISSLLSDTGEYDPVLIGKWHLGEADGARPQERLFLSI